MASLLHSVGCTEGLVRFQGFCDWFETLLRVYGEMLLAHGPTSKMEYHSLSAVRDCLFSIFAATLHVWRPFLHPHPEDAPCWGDWKPLLFYLKRFLPLYLILGEEKNIVCKARSVSVISSLLFTLHSSVFTPYVCLIFRRLCKIAKSDY